MKGEEFENKAVEYLMGLGWRVLERNYRCRGGEIDIVAMDGRELVFVEVKGGKTASFGDPLERFTRLKLLRILRCGRKFLHERHIRARYRVDLLVVRGGSIEHFKNIGFF
jgi:putative endonuclease